MSIQNLEQVRARHALDFAKSEAPKHGPNGGEAMKKIPPLILQSGLLAAIAFSIEERKNEIVRPGFAAAFDAISLHLCHEEIAILDGVRGAAALIDKLADSDSETLKLATAEALAWLGYARRFVTPGEGGEDS